MVEQDLRSGEGLQSGFLLYTRSRWRKQDVLLILVSFSVPFMIYCSEAEAWLIAGQSLILSLSGERGQYRNFSAINKDPSTKARSGMTM